MKNYLSFLAALISGSFKTHLLGFQKTLWMGIMMFLQSVAFFLLWMIFFTSVSSIKGWKLEDVAMLFGTIAFSFGIALFLGEGARQIRHRIDDGTFDNFLTKPRHPLALVVFSHTNAASLGDIFSGLFYWFFFAHLPLSRLPLALLLGFMGAVLWLSSLLIFHSMCFWFRKCGSLPDQISEALIIFSSAPPKAHPLAVKIVMFSIFPAGFIGLLPVEILRAFSFPQFAALMTSVIVYASLAFWVFDQGVKRYRTSM